MAGDGAHRGGGGDRRVTGLQPGGPPAPALDGIDAVVFDCDGVLVDITESYDMTIVQTVSRVLATIVGVEGAMDVGPETIDGFKSTGGFNDEVDLAYAAILSICAAARLGADQPGFVSGVIGRADSTGIGSVERYLEGVADMRDIRELLAYPGAARHSSLLSRIFDQIFYGSEGYSSMFGDSPPLPDRLPGLINRDRVILSGPLMDRLQSRFGARLAVVTGRGRRSAGHSLRGLLDRFDLDSSAFLEDEPREFAKPNPRRLLDCIGAMGATLTLYVGDSMEDLIMAGRATASGSPTLFCGITGASRNPRARRELFRENGADLVLDSIDMLPKALNLERGTGGGGGDG